MRVAHESPGQKNAGPGVGAGDNRELSIALQCDEKTPGASQFVAQFLAILKVGMMQMG